MLISPKGETMFYLYENFENGSSKKVATFLTYEGAVQWIKRHGGNRTFFTLDGKATDRYEIR